MNEDTLGEKVVLSAFADGELDAAQARDLAGRLATDPALRRVVTSYKALDAAALRLPVPELPQAAAAKAWRNVARRTCEVSLADQRAFGRIEAAAAALATPAVSNEAFGEAWKEIANRLQPEGTDSQFPNGRKLFPVSVPSVQAPEPDASQWEEVWRGIRAQTGLSRRRSLPWRWLAAASLAAAVLLGLLVHVSLPGPEQAALGVPEAPEVLDDRYQAHIQYTEGLRSPVVCFLLKDDTGLGGEKGQNWRWLPE